VRILNLIPSMAGGGAERQLALVTKGLVDAGHDVRVGLTAGGPNLERLEGNGARLHWLTSYGNYDVTLFLRVLGLVRSLRPSLVQTWLPRMDVFGGTAARLCGRPWVLSERNSGAAYEGFLKGSVRRRLGAHAQAVISNSEAGATYWRSVGVSPARSPVIPNGLPLEEIAKADPRVRALDAFANRPVILFAGRLEAQKNALTLVAALREVFAASNAVACLCGDGSERPRIELELERHHLSDRVLMLGFRSDLWSLMKAADVLVSVSLFEGHPNVVLEAMACECPVVVSDIPEHRECLDESEAWFVDPHDPSAVATGISNALTRTAEARSRGTKAYDRVRGLSATACSAHLEEVYRELVGESRSTRV